MSFRTTFLCLLLAFGIAISACSAPEDEAPAADATAPAAPAEAPAEADDGTATEEPAPAEVESVEETEGLADEDTADGEEISFDAPTPEQPAEPVSWQYSEGAHFRRMRASQGTSSPPDKIEVAEVFWYGCPHCYDFDPLLDDWKQKQPADVAFVRIPVIWNPTNQVHARAMYTAEALGVFEEAHAEIFKAIHQQNNSLSSEEGLAVLFARLGVDQATFSEAYNSFGVNSAVKRAENLTRRYGVRSVPVLIVNGKYATDGPQVRTYGDMLNLTEELVQRERLGE